MTVRWGYCPAEARLMLFRCSAVLGHHVSDSSLSLTLPAGHRYSQSLIAVTELCLYTIYGTRCVSYLWQRTHWGHWCKRNYIVGTRLLQRYPGYTSMNSWHCDKIGCVVSQSVQKSAARLIGTIFRDHYHYFTQPHGFWWQDDAPTSQLAVAFGLPRRPRCWCRRAVGRLWETVRFPWRHRVRGTVSQLLSETRRRSCVYVGVWGHLCFNRHSTVNCQPSTFTAFQPQITM